MKILTTLKANAQELATTIKNLTHKQSEQSDRSHIAFDSHTLDHPAVGLTPYRLHQLLTNAETGDLTAQADLFADMEERDSHIYSEMAKRKRAVQKLDWQLTPPKNATTAEKQATGAVQEMLSYMTDFEDVVYDALDAIGHGYSCQELGWVKDGSNWLIDSADFILPRRFGVDPTQPNIIQLKDGQGFGENALQPLQHFGWICHIHKAKSGYVSRAGLYRVLSWSYIFKNFSIRDLAEFLEIYGLPLRLGTYPAGATPKEKATLLQAVMQIGHRAAGIIPQGMMIDFKEAAKGTADPFEAMIRWCEMSQSKAILGSTLTTQADGKSSTNALGKIHNEGRIEIRDSDARQLASSFDKSLVSYLMQLNYPNIDRRRYPKFVFDVSEPEDIAVYADALPKLVGVGVQIPVNWAQEKLNIPQPVEGEAVLAQPNQASTNNATPLTQLTQPQLTQIREMLANAKKPPALPPTLHSEYLAAAQQQNAEQAVNAKLTDDKLNHLGQDLTADLISTLKDFDNFADALGYLAEYMPDVADSELMQTLEQLLFASQAVGMLDQAAARQTSED